MNAFATRYHTTTIDGLDVFYRGPVTPPIRQSFYCMDFRPARICSEI